MGGWVDEWWWVFVYSYVCMFIHVLYNKPDARTGDALLDSVFDSPSLLLVQLK